MAFQEFPKNYLNITMILIFLVPLFSALPAIFVLNLNEALLLLLAEKSAIAPLASKIAVKFKMLWNKYYYNLLKYILVLLCQCL